MMQFRNILQGKKNSDITAKRTISFNYDITEEKIKLNYQSIADEFMSAYIIGQKVTNTFSEDKKDKDARKLMKNAFVQTLKKLETHLLQGWKGVKWSK